MRNVYLDHAATTPLDPRVREAMAPYLGENFGNPSSLHGPGLEAKRAIDKARQTIARHLNAREDEIVFTSGGTESDNLAVLGSARGYVEHGRHIVTTPIEHHAVLEAVLHLQKHEGFEVTFVPVSSDGLVDPKDVEAAVRPDTVLVSVMAANNEVGTLEPIAEIGRRIQILRQRSGRQTPFFHTDACQAAGVLDLDVEKLHVDLMTFNGSKIYGPKGVGALYVKRGVRLTPLVFGGGQERGLRSGTENVAGIVGLAEALALAQALRCQENERQTVLRDKLVFGILKRVSGARLNGHPTERLPNNASLSFPGVEGEALLLYLDAQGIFVSTGSACASASLEPSHVLTALGLPDEAAHSSIRFSLGRSTTEDDIDYVLEVLSPLVEKLRSFSPVNPVRSPGGALNPAFADLFRIHSSGKTAGHSASNGVKS